MFRLFAFTVSTRWVGIAVLPGGLYTEASAAEGNRIRPLSLHCRIKQQIVSMDNLRIVRIAQNGCDLVSFQAHNFFQV